MTHAAATLGAFAAACLAATSAAAQGQVYDPLPPPGSAYVRIVNALGADVAFQSDFLPAQTVGTAPADRVTPYTVVEKVAGRALSLNVQAAGRTGRAVLHAEPGSFVTVLLGASDPKTVAATAIVDQTDFNQNRARLSFYNATPACAAATLALMPSGPAVFQGVEPGTAKARSVNPVHTEVRASCAGTGAPPPVSLDSIEAGGMYSIWLMEPGATPTAFLTRDVTAKWKP